LCSELSLILGSLLLYACSVFFNKLNNNNNNNNNNNIAFVPVALISTPNHSYIFLINRLLALGIFTTGGKKIIIIITIITIAAASRTILV